MSCADGPCCSDVASARMYLLYRWRRFLARADHLNADGVTPTSQSILRQSKYGFYHENIDGERFRNKVRLRTYGYIFWDGATLFLEVKHHRIFSIRKLRYKLSDPSHTHPKMIQQALIYSRATLIMGRYTHLFL